MFLMLQVFQIVAHSLFLEVSVVTGGPHRGDESEVTATVGARTRDDWEELEGA